MSIAAKMDSEAEEIKAELSPYFTQGSATNLLHSKV
jgi:hypothetical protein